MSPVEISVPYFDDTYLTVTLKPADSYRRVFYEWYRVYFKEYVGIFAGQALSLISFAAFIMSGIHRHD